ncbi:response regulator transcription factor [Cohnella cellulosilytica]|uniref:Helix-turn-helix domain-containing protein n=1 Tax=Cohnella cellulosilytica TaxID=986710 RepID=A0ABW2FHX2_9BACL
MLKVLIVDDEKPIRQWFEHVIRQNGDEFEIAGLAANGREALTLCMSSAPDIVITDIKMPVMDGLELIEQASKLNPEISFLILSNYDEFEFVRHGLRIGVKDYLLKAETDDQDIVAALRKMAEDRSGRTQAKDRWQLRDVLNSPEDWLPPEMLQGAMRWLICGRDGTPNTEEDAASSTLLEACKRWAAQSFPLARLQGFVDEGDNAALLLAFTDTAPPSGEELASRCRDWGAEARLRFSYTVSFGIGAAFSSAGAVKNEFRKAKRAFRCRFYTGEMSVNAANAGMSSDPSEEHAELAELMRPLKSAELLEPGLIESVLEKLDALKIRNVDPAEAKEAFRSFLERMEAQLPEETGQRDAKRPDAFGELDRLAYWEELRDAVRRHLRKMQETAYRRTFVYSETTNRIMAYIREHYADKLSMTVLAEQVHLNENYLSQMFKKETGKTITRYMIEVRMEQAKQRLATLRHKINRVAAEVGYASEAHFSTAFKAHYGITPSQYVDSLRSPKPNLSEPQDKTDRGEESWIERNKV